MSHLMRSGFAGSPLAKLAAVFSVFLSLAAFGDGPLGDATTWFDET